MSLVVHGEREGGEAALSCRARVSRAPCALRPAPHRCRRRAARPARAEHSLGHFRAVGGAPHAVGLRAAAVEDGIQDIGSALSSGDVQSSALERAGNLPWVGASLRARKCAGTGREGASEPMRVPTSQRTMPMQMALIGSLFYLECSSGHGEMR